MSTGLIGREPDPFLGPVRAFHSYPGFDIRYGSLAELRPAMVEDDIVFIDSMAMRVTFDRVIRAEPATRTPSPEDFARTRVHDIADQRHPYEEGLHGILELVYPEIADEESPIQLYDYPIVSALASRLNKAKQATVFKVDPAEGLAPLTQEVNKSRAVALAEARFPDEPEFSAKIQRVYGLLVPATVAVQQAMFDRTYLLSDRDTLGFRDLEPRE